MLASRGRDFSAPGSIAAGFGAVLHSCRVTHQQPAAVGLGSKGCLFFLYSHFGIANFKPPPPTKKGACQAELLKQPNRRRECLFLA